MSYIDSLIADRLGGQNFGKTTEIFKFEKIKRAKAAARLAHPDLPLIDMGVGEPDSRADDLVIEAIAREAALPENRTYADNGIFEFREAAARYLERTYRLTGIDPASQIVHAIGSKSALAMLPVAFINPGDVILMPTPCYPIPATWTRYLGGEVYPLPLYESNNFLPDFGTIPPSILRRAKLLYLNYPNNPTGAVADAEFFARVVEFAERNRIAVIHDAAYAALTYDGYDPLSFLSVPGAVEVGVETHSLSKAFNMTGWRIGFVCGNPQMITTYATIKDNTDSGQFRAIQKAAAIALAHPEITAATIEKYSRRFGLLVPALRELGFNAHKPSGSFYCYVKSPIAVQQTGTASSMRFSSAGDFSDWLLRTTLISTVPWDDAGAYLRFSVTFEADTQIREREIINELKRRLEGYKFIFD